MTTRSLNHLDDEASLLARASAWPHYPTLNKLTATVLQEITVDQGIDFATALLFDRIARSDEHKEVIRQIQDWQSDSCINSNRTDAASTDHFLKDITVAVAPGAFYADHPHTGAGGEVIREEATRLGCRVELIPTKGGGTVRQNGEFIFHWLAERSDKRIVLASLSKGGADVKMALAMSGADQVFRKVKAWLNVGGILSGSPMASWVLSRRFRTLFYRLMFPLKGHDFRFVTTLERRPDGDLAGPLHIPDHIQTIHILGFPLRKHMSSPRASRWHGRLEPLGPNDGVTLLSDAIQLPGNLLPVWGTDHYLQDGWNARGLISALLRYVASRQSLNEAVPADRVEVS